MLIGAKCMESISWVVQYIIFAIICALYSFDPVGLWLIGRTTPPIQTDRPEQDLKTHSVSLSSSYSSSPSTLATFSKRPSKKKFRKTLSGKDTQTLRKGSTPTAPSSLLTFPKRTQVNRILNSPKAQSAKDFSNFLGRLTHLPDDFMLYKSFFPLYDVLDQVGWSSIASFSFQLLLLI